MQDSLFLDSSLVGGLVGWLASWLGRLMIVALPGFLVNCWTTFGLSDQGLLTGPNNSLFSPHASNRVKPPRVGKSAVFYDVATKMPTFATKQDLESNDQPIAGYVKAEGKYNYYDEYYESNILSSVDSPQDVRSLPDPYSFDFEDYQENGGSFGYRRTIQNGLGSAIVWTRYPNY